MQAIYQLLRKLTLPGNAGTGARIVLDGTTDAILIYNASNQLVESIAATSGFDQFGNNFLVGHTSYNRTVNEFINVTGNNIIMGAMVAGQPSLTGAGFIQNAGNITLQSQVFGAFTAAVIANFNSGQGGFGTGSGFNPVLSLLDSTGNNPVDVDLSGNVIKTNTSGTRYTWQSPSYGNNWGGSTTFNGSANWGTATYRLDAEDNLHLGGAFKAGAVLPGAAVFNVPIPYRPSTQWAIPMLRNNGGVVTPFMGAITSSGNVDIVTQTGGGIAVNNEYLMAPTVIPLNNIP